MEIRLVKTSIMDLHLTSNADAVDDLRCSPVYREDQTRSFGVVFDVKAAFKPAGGLTLKYLSIFETTEDITDEFRASHFPRVNAPAVAYPYVRAFIAQFSVLAGFEAYTLPIRNFVKKPPPALPPPADVQALESP